MNQIIFSMAFLLLIFVMFWILIDRKNRFRFEFLSKEHTQILKCVAVLMVLISHMEQVYGLRILAPLGGAGVAIFLFVSGFGLQQSYGSNLKHYWKRRILKVFIPYWLVRCIYFIYEYISKGSRPGIVSFVLDITAIKPLDVVMWYLTMLLACYITFYIINKIHFLKKTETAVYVLFSIVLLFVPSEPWAQQAFSFTAGIIVAKNINKIKMGSDRKQIFKCFHLSALSFAIFALLLAIKQLPMVSNFGYLHFIYWLELVYKGALALFVIMSIYIMQKWVSMKILMKVSLISFEIYLTHPYFMQLLNKDGYFCIITFFACVALSSIFLMCTSSYMKKGIESAARKLTQKEKLLIGVNDGK